jgi:hypothetical protein
MRSPTPPGGRRPYEPAEPAGSGVYHLGRRRHADDAGGDGHAVDEKVAH